MELVSCGLRGRAEGAQGGKAEMVELRADCDICSCSLCKDHCTEVQSGLGDAPNGAHHAEKEVDKRSEQEKEGKGFLG